MARPTMIFPYLSDRRVGDGQRPAFVLSARGDIATLFVHSKLAMVTVPRSTIEKARVVPYKPAEVRCRILEKARYFRQHGKRFPRQPTVELLRMLGTGRGTIDATVNAEPLPETIAARGQRIREAERRIELAAAITAIREKIDMQPEEPTAPAARAHRPRLRYVHPDQLALAL